MLLMIFSCLFLATIVFFGIMAVKHMSSSDKSVLTKYTTYGIISLVVAVGLLTMFVILF